MKGLNAKARDLHEWIISNQYGVLESFSGSGHIRYRLRNGSLYVAAASPSRTSSVLNSKADIRRALGVSNEGTRQSGSYSFKKSDGFDGKVRQGDAMPAEVARRERSVKRTDYELTALMLMPPSRATAAKARALLRKRAAQTAGLERLGVAAPPMPDLESVAQLFG